LVDAATIGVICMDTSFTKILGHIRNPETFDFPVRYRVVRGATAELATGTDPPLLGGFIEAARDLENQGVAAITSGCGFLAIFQRELADAVKVPLYSSSLIQLPMVHRMLRRNQRVGLLLARERTFTRRHLAGVGAERVPVCAIGMEEQPEFREVILEAARDEIDVDRLGREVLDQVRRLSQGNPDLGALVIECTDLVPYAQAIQRQLNLPVFDIVTLTDMVHRSLTRGRFG